jgi:hypothetical protein
MCINSSSLRLLCYAQIIILILVYELIFFSKYTKAI